MLKSTRSYERDHELALDVPGKKPLKSTRSYERDRACPCVSPLSWMGLNPPALTSGIGPPPKGVNRRTRLNPPAVAESTSTSGCLNPPALTSGIRARREYRGDRRA